MRYAFKDGVLDTVCGVATAFLRRLPTFEIAHDVGDPAVADGELIIVKQFVGELDGRDGITARIGSEKQVAQLRMSSVEGDVNVLVAVEILTGKVSQGTTEIGGRLILFEARERQSDFTTFEVAAAFFL